MTTIYLTGQTRSLPIESSDISFTMISEYLKNTINSQETDLEVELITSSKQHNAHFNFSGAVRLEILFYEKRPHEEGREHITLYGVAENTCFQLRSFTVSYRTCWLVNTITHPDDRYFDSIIIEGYTTENIFSSSYFVSIRDPAGTVIGHSAAHLRFTSGLMDRTRAPVPLNPMPPTALLALT